MVSSRYGPGSGEDDEDGADQPLAPDSVPDGPVPAAATGAVQARAGPGYGNRISEDLPFGVIVLNSSQEVVYANPAHRELLGADVANCRGIEDWLRHGCRDPDYAEMVVGSWRDHLWRKQLPRVFSLKSADEKLREIEFQAKLLDDGGLLLTLFDVTESRRSEDALRQTETKFNTVFEHVTIGVALADRTGRFFEVNPAFEEFLDYRSWELRQMSLSEVVAPDDIEALRRIESELEVPGISGDRKLSIRFLGKDDRRRLADVTVSPIRDNRGETAFFAYFVRDTSGEQEIRNDLRESQEQNRALLEAIPDLIVLLDGDGRIDDLIPPSDEWSGVEPSSSWVGRPLAEVWPEFAVEAGEVLRRTLATGQPAVIECQLSNRVGSVVHYSARISPCGQKAVVAIIADETDQALAREVNQRQSVAFRHLQDGIILADLKGRITDWNAAAERMFGYEKEEIAGSGLARLYAEPGEEVRFNRRLSVELTGHGRWQERTAFFRKDGSSGEAEMLFVPVEEAGTPRSLLGIQREITGDSIDLDGLERAQHRMRNQLQLVTSLFGLEAGVIGREDFQRVSMLQRLQGRLRAVMRLHEGTQEGMPERIGLVRYVRGLADDLVRICASAAAGRPAIRVTGDEQIMIDSEKAPSLGLLIADIGTAALGERRGVEPKSEIGGGANGFQVQVRRTSDGRPELTIATDTVVSARLSKTILKALVDQFRGTLTAANRNGRSEFRIQLSTKDGG